ncbi:MAG: hypothetical protein ACHQSE_04185 [Gemmatimonadales bacterium]
MPRERVTGCGRGRGLDGEQRLPHSRVAHQQDLGLYFDRPAAFAGHRSRDDLVRAKTNRKIPEQVVGDDCIAPEAGVLEKVFRRVGVKHPQFTAV